MICEVAGIAQLVQRRAKGWTARVRFPEVHGFSLIHSVQTASGDHPASYPMGTGGSFWLYNLEVPSSIAVN
jgi:hypothetical protein